MCGIFALLNSDNYNQEEIKTEFMKGKQRGPKFSKIKNFFKMTLGFHGLNNNSNQPLIYNDIILICNGEIYNYKELFHNISVTPISNSDCEIIIHLYLKYGISQTLLMLDGVFSFILYDNRISLESNLINRLYVARDPLGIRPLYYLKNNTIMEENNLINLIGFASELKCIEKFYNSDIEKYSIEQFKPGTYSIFQISNKVNSIWIPERENILYFTPTFSYNTEKKINDSSFFVSIANYLNSSVIKRYITTERPVACLLSGGLDSSLITALVNNYNKMNYINTPLETYSIGLQDSEDLKYARIVADYLESKHTEIIISEKEMFDCIPNVIKAIESYDVTTVRASIGNYLLGKYISENSNAKVIFNGDGSDELFGGYLYMNYCSDNIEFDKESRRLLNDIHLFDVLRSDKSISSHGLEPRTPFLDRSFVNFILSIPPEYRNHKNYQLFSNNNNNKKKYIEKYILRESFTISNFKNYKNMPLLPDEILWRKKEAFSDGVSSKERSLFKILQEFILKNKNINDSNLDLEKKYYKKIFDSFYPNCSSILPYYWMPKFTNSCDPSARTLKCYN
jgi:asparagine synthase (glutamine-hydrolysing)